MHCKFWNFCDTIYYLRLLKNGETEINYYFIRNWCIQKMLSKIENVNIHDIYANIDSLQKFQNLPYLNWGQNVGRISFRFYYLLIKITYQLNFFYTGKEIHQIENKWRKPAFWFKQMLDKQILKTLKVLILNHN